MPKNIPPVLEKTDFEALAEPVREYFIEKDGKYYPSFSQDAIEQLAVGLRQNRDDILKEKRELQEKFSKYEQFGSPDEIKEKLEKAAKNDSPDIAKLKQSHADALEALKQAAQKEVADAEKKYAERNQTLERGLANALLDSAVKEATIHTNGNLELLGPILEKHLKVVERETPEGIKFDVAVLDSEGKPRIADALGTPLSPSQFVNELKENPKYQGAFFADQKGGSQSTNNQKGIRSGDKNAINRTQFEQMSHSERDRFFADGGSLVE